MTIRLVSIDILIIFIDSLFPSSGSSYYLLLVLLHFNKFSSRIDLFIIINFLHRNSQTILLKYLTHINNLQLLLLLIIIIVIIIFIIFIMSSILLSLITPIIIIIITIIILTSLYFNIIR
jgi:hypothetical protein